MEKVVYHKKKIYYKEGYLPLLPARIFRKY